MDSQEKKIKGGAIVGRIDRDKVVTIPNDKSIAGDVQEEFIHNRWSDNRLRQIRKETGYSGLGGKEK